MQTPRDENRVPSLMGVSNVDGITPVTIYVDPITHRVLVSAVTNSGIETPTGTINGINKTFTVLNTPQFITYNGQIMYENGGYTLSSLTITMDDAPATGSILRSHY